MAFSLITDIYSAMFVIESNYVFNLIATFFLIVTCLFFLHYSQVLGKLRTYPQMPHDDLATELPFSVGDFQKSAKFYNEIELIKYLKKEGYQIDLRYDYKKGYSGYANGNLLCNGMATDKDARAYVIYYLMKVINLEKSLA